MVQCSGERHRRASTPNEARFGFGRGQRLSHSASLSQVRTTPAPSVADPDEEQNPQPKAPLSARGAAAEAQRMEKVMSVLECSKEGGDGASFSLLTVLEMALGDPDASLPLLRSKPFGNKYDFKGRIAALEEQNRAFRIALLEKRDGHRILAEALSRLQQIMNERLRHSEGEAAGARQQLDERGKMADMLQEVVRAVWREETASSQECQSPDLQEQILALKQCCAAEAERAAMAQAIAQEREEELRTLRQELEDLRRGSSEKVLAADMKAARATELVKEAGRLLSLEAAESARHHQEVVATSTDREKTLTAQLLRAEARANNLEIKLNSVAKQVAGGHGGA